MTVMDLAPAFAEPITVIRGHEPVPPEGIYALAPVVVLVLLFFAYRLLRRRRRPTDLPPSVGFMSRLGSGSGTGAGNALVEMNAMLDPSRPVIMMMESDCDRDPVEVGDDRDP